MFAHIVLVFPRPDRFPPSLMLLLAATLVNAYARVKGGSMIWISQLADASNEPQISNQMPFSRRDAPLPLVREEG